MVNTIKIAALDSTPIEYVETVPKQGAFKDVYFSPDKSYAVAFFRDFKKGTPEYSATKERLLKITGVYRDKIFNQVGGEYWKNLYCWPEKIVEHNDRIGVVVPTYPKHFYFEFGSKNDDALGIKGSEKEGKWFSASNRNRFLDNREKGTLITHLRICINISRAVRRMHAAGLAHSDLSYKNVLIDPVTGNASIIDIDDLVVPDMFPPNVMGTTDFIAPEVLATQKFPKEKRILPSRSTDQHALATLIYMYLLFRHPLKGKKVHHPDPQEDDLLAMGEKALFIEHPTDTTNRPNLQDQKPSDFPWIDTKKLPYTILGPYLVPLFNKAFINGLHNPQERPLATEWEQVLIKTVDLLQPCQNSQCEQKWFVFDNKTKPSCPYCGTEYKGELPVLDFYSPLKEGRFTYDNHRLMVYNGQNIYQWHVNKNIFPNEQLTDEQRKPVADFQIVNDKWYLINRKLTSMYDKTENKHIPPNSMVELTSGKQILLSSESGGRLTVITKFVIIP
ncbi:MAG: kinase [Beggiatoa sp. IS2]|nr:MAG: kinase [Beggiatoa sp. IS2]